MTTVPISSTWSRISHQIRHPLVRLILFPFFLFRTALLAIAYLSQLIPILPGYPNPEAVVRGWEFHRILALDTWARWDSGWYFSIMQGGYALHGNPSTIESNIAFYPVYPYLVRILAQPLRLLFHSQTAYLITGILVSSALLIGALFFIYKLIILDHKDESIAERSILYVLAFPTGFIFSSLYTESTFLFFAVASFFSARRNIWWLTGILAAFAAITRPLGFLIIIPLGIIYFENLGWQLRKIGLKFFWLLLAPLALLGYMASLMPITHDLFAIFKVQQAWGKTFALPWETLFHPTVNQSYYTIVNQIIILISLILSIIIIVRLRSLSYGIFPLIMIMPLLFTGTIQSSTRYCSVLFPIFILLGIWGKNDYFNKTLLALFFAVQVVYMMLWTRFYFIP